MSDTFAQSRAIAGHSQRAAAELLGVHWRTLQNWETGKVPVPVNLLALYRHLTGIEAIPFRRRPRG